MIKKKAYVLITIFALSGIAFSPVLAQTVDLAQPVYPTRILTINPDLLLDPALTDIGTVSPALTDTTTPPADSTTANPDGTVTTGTFTPATTDTATTGSATDTTVTPDRPVTDPFTGQTDPSTTTISSTDGTATRLPSGTSGTSTRTPATTVPPAETPAEEICPPINPLSPEPIECPKTEQVPVIPQAPYLLLATPLLGTLLFLLIFSALSRRQGKLESLMQQKHLSSEHQKTIAASRKSLYLNLLEQLSGQLGSTKGLEESTLQQFASRIELLGSKEIQAINQKLSAAAIDQNRPELKKLLKELALQIRKEL